MSAFTQLLTLKPTEMTPVRSDWEDRLVKEIREDANDSSMSSGDLTVRYLSGRIDGNLRKLSSFEINDRPFPKSVTQNFSLHVPDVQKAELNPRGFNEHAISLCLSVVSVMSAIGLFGAAVGLCIFLIGVALPFDFV